MTKPKFDVTSSLGRKRNQREQQQDREAFLRDSVEIRRLKFVNVVHEKAVGKITVDVDVQIPAVWVDESCKGAQYADDSEASSALPCSYFLHSIGKSIIARGKSAARGHLENKSRAARSRGEILREG